VLDGIVELRRAIELIDAGDKVSGETCERNRPLILRQNNVVEGGAVCYQVDIFLIRLPADPAARQEANQVQLIVLVLNGPSARLRMEGVGVVEYAEIGARLRPQIVGLGGMNVGIVPAVSGQDVVVVCGIRHLLADIQLPAIDCGNGGPVHQAVNEGSVCILENLLDARKLIGRLRPVVVFHRNDEHCPDFLRVGARTS
jgi:hypothetical protein